METVKLIQNNKIIKNAIIVLLGTILLTISAKVKIPFYPVPMTMQTFVVIFLGMCFGYKLGLATVALYLIEGIVGIPVFSNSPEKGVGMIYFTGPTMGYLLGFIIAVYVAGRFNFNKNYLLIFSLLAVSDTFLLHNSNTLWICSHLTLSADMGLSGGSAFLFGSAKSAFSTSSASAGLAR